MYIETPCKLPIDRLLHQPITVLVFVLLAAFTYYVSFYQYMAYAFYSPELNHFFFLNRYASGSNDRKEKATALYAN